MPSTNAQRRAGIMAGGDRILRTVKRMAETAKLRRTLYLTALSRKRMWDNAPSRVSQALRDEILRKDAIAIERIATLAGELADRGDSLDRLQRIVDLDRNFAS